MKWIFSRLNLTSALCLSFWPWNLSGWHIFESKRYFFFISLNGVDFSTSMMKQLYFISFLLLKSSCMLAISSRSSWVSSNARADSRSFMHSPKRAVALYACERSLNAPLRARYYFKCISAVFDHILIWIEAPTDFRSFHKQFG